MSKQSQVQEYDNKYYDVNQEVHAEKHLSSKKRPPFKQGNRCCWGGMPLWGFILMVIFIVLCVLVAILIPVLFIPVAQHSVQKTVDNTNFAISDLHSMNFDPELFQAAAVPAAMAGAALQQAMASQNTSLIATAYASFASAVTELNATSIKSRYLLVNASLTLSNVDDLADGAELQPATVELANNEFSFQTSTSSTKVNKTTFGKVTIPAAKMVAPTTEIKNQVVTLEAYDENLDVPLPALPAFDANFATAFAQWYAIFSQWQVTQVNMNLIAGCYKVTNNTCSWLATGKNVVQKKLAATTMWYGATLTNKVITFDVPLK